MPKLFIQPWQQAIAKKSQSDLLKAISATDAELKSIILDSVPTATSIIEGLPGASVGVATRRAQYITMRGGIAQYATDLWSGEIEPTILSGLRDATSASVEGHKSLLKVLSQASKQNTANLARSMYASSTNSYRAAQARLLNDIDLSKAVYNNTAYMTGKIDKIVNDSLLLEQSAKEIASSVSEFISPTAAGGVKYNAMRLGRTELNNSFHTMTKINDAQSPWVEGVAWNLSGSHPEDDECNEFAEQNDFDMGDGIWPVDQVPDPPHPQCFCYTTSITMKPDEFVNKLADGDFDEGLNSAGLAQSAMCS